MEKQKEMMHGTSMKSLQRATSTYLNTTGPGDYSLPKLIGSKEADSRRPNVPQFSMRGHTRMPWDPNYKVDFIGRSSPSPTKYNPIAPEKYKNASAKYAFGTT